MRRSLHASWEELLDEIRIFSGLNSAYTYDQKREILVTVRYAVYLDRNEASVNIFLPWKQNVVVQAAFTLYTCVSIMLDCKVV